jgi:hypothetical protein
MDQQEQQRQWIDKRGINGMQRGSRRRWPRQVNDSDKLATESAMTGAARGQRLEEVDKESDGKDYGKREVNPNSQSSSAL